MRHDVRTQMFGDVSCPVHATRLVVCCSVFVFASDFCLSFPHKGLGLTFIFVHVLVRAPIEEPGSQPTDTRTLCVIRALVPTFGHRMCVSSP